MTVYVDDMFQQPMGQLRRMKMSHLIADTQAELLAMVDTIGVQRKWIQHAGEPGEHFDIAMVKRELAIAAGAVPITLRQCAAMCFRRRIEGVLGAPAEAEAWRDAWSRNLKRELA